MRTDKFILQGRSVVVPTLTSVYSAEQMVTFTITRTLITGAVRYSMDYLFSGETIFVGYSVKTFPQYLEIKIT
jgi:hypothetical protein